VSGSLSTLSFAFLWEIQKTGKKNVKNKISMDQFVDHFKNLISNDNVDNGLDTTDTMECVFEELDKPFTENEIETCIKGLRYNNTFHP
jgi:hypoxanthine phosphoribosyltransferase